MDISTGGSATEPLVGRFRPPELSREKVVNVRREENKTQHDTPQVSCATEKTISHTYIHTYIHILFGLQAKSSYVPLLASLSLAL